MTARYEYVGGELELFARAHNWKRYFASRLAPHIRGDVLEVGAGIGETTRQLCTGEQRSWLCLEPDSGLARQLGDSLTRAPLKPRPEVVVGTVTDLGRERRFDAILYIDVLEHIEHDRQELVNASGRLNRGGVIAVLSPAFNLLFSDFDRSIGHYRRYTRRSLARVFPASMTPLELTYLDSVGFFASLANRTLFRQSLPTSRQIDFWDGVMVPISRWTDPALRLMFGRSVLAVYAAR